MQRFIKNIGLKAGFIFLFVFIFINNIFGQATCDALPGQILIDLANQANLPAVAAQYQLNPTPLDQTGTHHNNNPTFLFFCEKK